MTDLASLDDTATVRLNVRAPLTWKIVYPTIGTDDGAPSSPLIPPGGGGVVLVAVRTADDGRIIATFSVAINALGADAPAGPTELRQWVKENELVSHQALSTDPAWQTLCIDEPEMIRTSVGPIVRTRASAAVNADGAVQQVARDVLFRFAPDGPFLISLTAHSTLLETVDVHRRALVNIIENIGIGEVAGTRS